MATLKLTYKEVWVKVAEYLGLSSAPSGADLIKVQDITKRAYRKFLMPIDASTGSVYRWKFLERTTTLSVVSGTDTYKLPKGFSSFITSRYPFTCISPTTWNPEQKSVAYLYEQQSRTTTTGYPQYFALKTGDFDSITGQLYEVMFWPTPSASLTYYYSFIFTPPAPVEDGDVFIGDALVSEAMHQCALAEAELTKHDEPRGQSTERDRIIQSMIGKDKADALVPNLGQMADGRLDGYRRSAIVYDEADGTQILPE